MAKSAREARTRVGFDDPARVAGVALWQKAASFAARAHEHQTRSDGRTPYFAHPARVAMIVREVFGCADAETVAAAYLHDTIEDTTTDFDELAEEFGATVARLVGALTKNAALPEADRERVYDDGLGRADWRARLIKLADVYDNFSDSASLSPQKRRKIDGKMKRAIALAEDDAAGHPETARAIAALQALARSRR